MSLSDKIQIQLLIGYGTYEEVSHLFSDLISQIGMFSRISGKQEANNCGI